MKNNYSRYSPDYWKSLDKGYPKYINWKIVAKAYNKDGSEKKLDPIQQYEVIYNSTDLEFWNKHTMPIKKSC
jgi:hypothetical protein